MVDAVRAWSSCVPERQVFQSEQKLRHLPFFEEVAAHEEGDAAWRSATAGLVVLRLVDAWLENGPSVVADDGWSVRNVRAAIESVDDGTPTRSILHRVVDALLEQRPDIHVVVKPLMAFAQTLEYSAKWFLAADVYRTVLMHLHPSEDSDAVIAANLRLGQCYRNLNMIDDAAAAFLAASAVSQSVGDMVGTLRAQIGEARVAIMRGNYPLADRLLLETIEKAQGPAYDDVRSRALHDRSAIAYDRGDYELAVKFGYEALQQSQSPSERDRVLGDIATAFMSLGVYSAARDAYLILSVTAQEQYGRWMAQLNLMELATDTGAELQFEQYRRGLEDHDLPPFLATAYELTAGRGLCRFGQYELGVMRIERGRMMALEHRLNAVVFRAEALLAEAKKTAPPPRLSSPVPLDLEEVATAISELRQEAGVG